MSDGTHRWRSRLDTALTVAAIAATLFAVAVLITLGWWVRSLSTATPSEAALQSVPDPVRRPPAAPPRVAPQLRQAAPPGQQAAVAVAAPQIAGPTAAPQTRGPNDDAAKNRALGAALSRLGNDPDLQRRLAEEAARRAP